MQDSVGIGESVVVTVIRRENWLQQNWLWIVAIIIVFIIFWSLIPRTNVYVRKEVSQ